MRWVGNVNRNYDCFIQPNSAYLQFDLSQIDFNIGAARLTLHSDESNYNQYDYPSFDLIASNAVVDEQTWTFQTVDYDERFGTIQSDVAYSWDIVTDPSQSGIILLDEGNSDDGTSVNLVETLTQFQNISENNYTLSLIPSYPTACPPPVLQRNSGIKANSDYFEDFFEYFSRESDMPPTLELWEEGVTDVTTAPNIVLNPVADTTLSDQFSQTNYGLADLSAGFRIGWDGIPYESPCAFNSQAFLMQFDMADVDYEILRAQLVLDGSSNDAIPLAQVIVTNAVWDEQTVTWNAFDLSSANSITAATGLVDSDGGEWIILDDNVSNINLVNAIQSLHTDTNSLITIAVYPDVPESCPEEGDIIVTGNYIIPASSAPRLELWKALPSAVSLSGSQTTGQVAPSTIFAIVGLTILTLPIALPIEKTD